MGNTQVTCSGMATALFFLFVSHGVRVGVRERIGTPADCETRHHVERPRSRCMGVLVRVATFMICVTLWPPTNQGVRHDRLLFVCQQIKAAQSRAHRHRLPAGICLARWHALLQLVVLRHERANKSRGTLRA